MVIMSLRYDTPLYYFFTLLVKSKQSHFPAFFYIFRDFFVFFSLPLSTYFQHKNRKNRKRTQARFFSYGLRPLLRFHAHICLPRLHHFFCIEVLPAPASAIISRQKGCCHRYGNQRHEGGQSHALRHHLGISSVLLSQSHRNDCRREYG